MLKIININKRNTPEYKRGQVFTLDFIIGFVLFLIVIILSIRILLSIPTSEIDVSLNRESVFLTDSIVSQGYPYNWNTSNVIVPGISSNNRIDLQKLKYMDNLSYDHTKALYHLSNDYLFFFSNKTNILDTGKCSYGYPINYTSNCSVNLSSIYYKNLVKIDRIVLLNSSVVKMTFYLWNNN